MESFDVDEKTVLKLKDLCAQFLGEEWSKREVKIGRIVAGAANRIYHCSLIGPKDTANDVIVRINGSEFYENAAEKVQMKDEYVFNSEAVMVIISQTASEAGLSPNLLGVFSGGSIEEFIEGRNLVLDDFNDRSLYSSVAKILAKYHALNIPVRRRPLTTDNCAKFDSCPEPDFAMIDAETHEIIKELFALPVAEEGKWIAETAHKLNARVVFSHNDLHCNNIILKRNFADLDDRLLIVDFELSRYNYRGYDLAFFMNTAHEFIVSHDKQMAGMHYTGNETPEDVKQLMVEEYLKQWKDGNNEFDAEIDNCEQIYKEIEFFKLQHYLTMICFTQFLFMDPSRRVTTAHIAPLIRRYWQQKQLFQTKYSNVL